MTADRVIRARARYEAAIADAEREEQLRIARPYGYTRQRLDANTRAVNRLREAHNGHVTWSETLRDQARTRLETHDQELRTHLDIATAMHDRLEQLETLVQTLIRTLATDTGLDEDLLYAAAAMLHERARDGCPSQQAGFRSFLDEPGVREAS